MMMENSVTESRYTHFEKIGEGGLGEVYKAWDNQLQRWVAIKRMMGERGNLVSTTSITAWQEAMRLASFSHPHIVTVYDFGHDEKGSYVVMEYLQGETLEDFVARGVMREEDFIELMRQVLEGIVAAHQKSLVHRDLKPGNIMLVRLPSGRFQAKVLDFGLSEFLKGAKAAATDASGSLYGSVYYMAPEQCRGEMIDARADLYAIGCIGYFCLTGRNAFDGDDVEQVMQAHLDHRYIPLLQLRPDVSAGVASWVEQLMSLAPDQRPSSAALALQNLNAIVAAKNGSHSVDKVDVKSAGNPGTAAAKNASALLPQESNSGMKWAVAVSALVLIGAFGFWFLMKQQQAATQASASVVSVPSVPPVSRVTEDVEIEKRGYTETTSVVENNQQKAGSGLYGMSRQEAGDSTRRYDPKDLDGLRRELGNVVTVEGEVERWGQNKAKTLYYINFDQDYSQALALVIRREKFLEQEQEAVLKNMVGKRVRYTGRVSEFQNRLQIFVDDVEKIIVE
jgi:serine/threonine protein kinase